MLCLCNAFVSLRGTVTSLSSVLSTQHFLNIRSIFGRLVASDPFRVDQK